MLDKTSKNKDIEKLVHNFIQLSDDLAYLSGKLRTEKSEKTFEVLNKILLRMENIDGPTLRKFLQEEGIRARMF